MFLDDFDPYSPGARARRSAAARAERQAYYRGLEEGIQRRHTPELPLPHESPNDRTIPILDIGPRVRGVYEKEATWLGTRSFLVVAESGAPIMDVTVPESLATGRFIHSLHRFLEREDPRPTLKAV